MERTRFAAVSALLLAFVIASVASGAAVPPNAGPTAAVAWPTSALVVSEVATGGASASDEFVEIANQGSAPVDLADLELAYATSSGSTVTRKATWVSPRILEPGQRLLVANALGSYAALADATYSGGFAATGGALVLRAVGGGPVDAVGWGDATNGFVEGSAAPAPPAGSSIERRPGGIDGNGLDSNDNASDWLVQHSPSPQNLAAPPVPGTTPPPATPEPTVTPGLTDTPSPTATPEATATATPTPTPGATPTPEATPTQTPDATPTPEPTATPTPAPTVSPTPTITATASLPPSASPAPSSTPTPAPEPTASPAPSSPVSTTMPIAEARLLPVGSTVAIAGVLTTQLGALESGRAAFVQDHSGGIAIYLDVAAPDPWAAGTLVSASGEIDERYGARTLRVALVDLVAGGSAPLPDALLLDTGLAGEVHEAIRIEVSGTTVGSPSVLADGTGLSVDDGSGQLRVIVGPAALGALSVPPGTSVRAVGPLGQRDSSGTGTSGYRLHATLAGAFEILQSPSPSPSPSPTPTPTPAPSPTPTAAPSPSPSVTPRPTLSPAPSPSAAPSPSPSSLPPGIVSIATARSQPIGATVTVHGEVIAELGRLGTPPLFAVADATGGVVVRLPDEAPSPARGTGVVVTGKLADPYGQLEIRPAKEGITAASAPATHPPLEVGGSGFGEMNEGMLASVVGQIAGPPRKATSGDLQFDVATGAGEVRVLTDASSGIDRDDFVIGATYRLTGVVGQRASRKGALDGYRLWLRDPADLARLPSGSPSGSGPAVLPISEALGLDDGEPTVIEGVVTADARLLDASGRRIVVDDGTGAVEVLLLPTGRRPSIGTSLRASGEMGHAYGAPRLRAEAIEILGPAGAPTPTALTRPPLAAHEWRLVRMSGTIAQVRRLGERWTAEIVVGGSRVPIVGLPGAGIASTALVEGRPATVTGIVRRPYPSAADRRFAVVPRGPSDISSGPGRAMRETGAAGPPARPSAAAGSFDGRADVAPYVDVDLGQLDEYVGRRVRVGGLVVAVEGEAVVIDDGTARGRLILIGEAADFLPLLSADDAVNAIGVVERRGGTSAVIVDEAGGLLRVGALGELVPLASSGRTAGPEGSAAADGAGGARRAGLAEGFGLALDGATGAASLLLAALASVAVTLLRRYRDRRLLARRVASRLTSLGLQAAPPAGEGG